MLSNNITLHLFISIIFSAELLARLSALFAMRANLVLKLLRVSSGKLSTHIILEQQAEFER